MLKTGFSPPGVTVWSSISPLLHQCLEGVFDGAQPIPQLGGFAPFFAVQPFCSSHAKQTRFSRVPREVLEA
jgi:hypothetical protein